VLRHVSAACLQPVHCTATGPSSMQLFPCVLQLQLSSGGHKHLASQQVGTYTSLATRAQEGARPACWQGWLSAAGRTAQAARLGRVREFECDRVAAGGWAERREV
jgi:hypothetical protein